MMGVLPGAEGVPVNIELSINRCWPRTGECHCHCSGAAVQWCSGHVCDGPVVKPGAQVGGAVRGLPSPDTRGQRPH